MKLRTQIFRFLTVAAVACVPWSAAQASGYYLTPYGTSTATISSGNPVSWTFSINKEVLDINGLQFLMQASVAGAGGTTVSLYDVTTSSYIGDPVSKNLIAGSVATPMLYTYSFGDPLTLFSSDTYMAILSYTGVAGPSYTVFNADNLGGPEGSEGDITPTPEPATYAMFGGALLLMWFARSARRAKSL